MANMFSGKNDKRIPTTLNECLKPDSTVTDLHRWAVLLESWGKILLYILIIAGAISIIIKVGFLADAGEDMIIPTIITSLITWGLCAFLEYIGFHVIALLISALASITQNTIISANVALFESGKNNGVPEATQPSPSKAPLPNRNLPKGQKKCYACGHVQSDHNTRCEKCGEFLY